MKAEEEYQKLLNSREPYDYSYGLVSLLCLNLLQGKFEKVEILGGQGIEFANKVGEDVWKSRWHSGFAEYYLRSGNPERALKECDEAWNIAEEADYISGQRRALYNKGLALLEMKSLDEAQRAADNLKEMLEKGMNKKFMRFYHNLTGWIELERGNFSEATEYFKKAISLLSFGPLTKRADFIDSLALAYYKSGDLKKAREEYERITYLTTGRFYYGDIYAKSFYMLAKIHEQQGQKNKAIEHYEKFLDLWKDADHGIAEFEDAKKRLAGVKSKPET
jgi:tetratricopeptide (TPR) repeat protein